MDSNPPLNLSTSVKVDDFNNESTSISNVDSATFSDDIAHQSNEDQSVVLVHNPSNNEDQVFTITGEPVEEKPEIVDATINDNNDFEDSENSVDLHDAEKELGNEDEKEFKCSHCSEIFLRASQLLIHAKNHEVNNVHSCDVCSQTFLRLSTLLRHKVVHNENPKPVLSQRVYKCTDCDISIANYTKFRLHMKNHKGDKKFHCEDCNMSFVQQSHLVTHKRKHTGEKPYECYICLSRFKQVSHLTTHIRTHTKAKPYTCEYCDASFSQTGSLKRHKRSHTGEKPYVCQICTAAFVEKRNLSRHLLAHSGIKPFKCDVCPASFTQLIDLKRHKYSHSGYKPFKCDVCGATFSRKNNLRWHKLTHEGDTPHVCEICNVGFKLARDLKNHKRNHVENKPYACNECNASYFQLNTLKRHKLVHTGRKHFWCDVCSATFYERSALKRHMARHEPVKKQFLCSHCVSAFHDARALKRHLLVVHKEGKYEDEEIDGKKVINKKNDALESGITQPSGVVDDENSLHIYEPSYQKGSPVVQSSSSVSGISTSGENVHKHEMRVPLQESVCQVVVSETVGDNNMPMPTLMLSQPGQPPKAARPAGNCQNHHSHIHTLVEGGIGQWQTWCFCETPNIPINSDSVNVLPSDSQLINPAMSQPYGINLNYQEGSQTLSKSMNPDPHISSEPLQLSSENKDQSLKDQYQSLNIPISAELRSVSTSSYQQYSSNVPTFSCDNTVVQNHQVISSDFSQIPSKDLSQDAGDLSVSIGKRKHGIEPDMTKQVYYSEANAKEYEMDPNVRSFDSVIVENKANLPEAAIQNINVQHKSNPQNVNMNFYNDNNGMTVDSCKEVTIVRHAYGAGNTSEGMQVDPLDFSNIVQSTQSGFSNGNFSRHSDVITQVVSVIDKNKEMQISDHSASFSLSEAIQIHCPKESNTVHPLNIYEDMPQETAETIAKDNVTLQYSLTVNNPATGEIQIQSDVFSAKTDEPSNDNLSKKPIKKRTITKSKEVVKKILKCSLCPKEFAKQDRLNLHVRKHYGDRPFVCGVCNQTFAHSNSLTIHIRSHTGERPFVCTHCGASFTQKSNLGVHLRTHTGEKPFKCDVCESSFSQGSHLIAHKRIHSNERPFVCDKCGQAFTQKSALKRHEIKHTGSKASLFKPLSCKECSEKFSLKADLKKHLLTHTESNTSGDSTSAENCSVDASSSTSVKPKNTRKKKVNSVDKTFLSVETEASSREKENLEEVETNEIENSNYDLATKENKEKELGMKEEVKSADEDDVNTIEDECQENANIEETRGKNSSTTEEDNEESISKSHHNETLKKSKKPVIEPVRSSRRIKEAAQKRRFKEDPDFITGDLNEIDQMEELENRMIMEAHLEKSITPDNVNQNNIKSEIVKSNLERNGDNHVPLEKKNDAFITTVNKNNTVPQSADMKNESVHSWCFCEVPHRPDEPHTFTDTATFESNSQPNANVADHVLPGASTDNILINTHKGREEVLQFTLPQLPQRIILPDQLNTVSHIPLNTENIVINSTPNSTDHQVLTSNASEIQSLEDQYLSSSNQMVAGQDIMNTEVIQDNGKALFGTTQILSGHVLPSNTQFVTPEGTFFIEAGDIISGTVVLNSAPGSGALFFDISGGDGQLVNLSGDSVLVGGSSVHGSGSSTVPIYSSSALPDSDSFANRENHSSLQDAVSSQPTNELSSEIVGHVAASGQTPYSPVESIRPNTETLPLVQYTNLDGNPINLFNPSLSVETSTQPSSSGVCDQTEFQNKTPPSDHYSKVSIVLVPSKCSICRKEFAVKNSLKQHMKTVHPGLHFCTLCFEAFTSKQNLITHKLRCKSSFPCPECASRFATKITLNVHRQKIHNISGLTTLPKKTTRNFHCSQCDSSFFQLSDLSRHVLGHTGEKPFKCEQCDTGFTRKSSLTKHYRIHTGEKPYKCPECSFCFSYRYQFNRHMETHCNLISNSSNSGSISSTNEECI